MTLQQLTKLIGTLSTTVHGFGIILSLVLLATTRTNANDRNQQVQYSGIEPADEFEYPSWAFRCRNSNLFRGQRLFSCVPLRRCQEVARLFELAFFVTRDPGMQEDLDRIVCGIAKYMEPKVCCPSFVQTPATSVYPSTAGQQRGQVTQVPRGPEFYTEDAEFNVEFSRPKNAVRVFSRPPRFFDLDEENAIFPNQPWQQYRPENEVRSDHANAIEQRSSCGLSSITVRIAGGTGSLPGEWPWAAAIGRRDLRDPKRLKWGCGGALITAIHVLTAAHCLPFIKDQDKVVDSTRLRAYVVRLGDVNILSESDEDEAFARTYRVAKAYKHANYQKSPSFWNDIAVLQLEKPTKFSEYLSPVCLPTPSTQASEATRSGEMIAIGWGADGSSKDSVVDQLQSVSLPLVDFETCVDKYSDFDIPLEGTQFCAGRTGKDTCRGDSGAPTMRFNPIRGAFEVIGITSIGSTKCGTGIPGVYTRVEAFVEWIDRIIRST